MALPPLSAPLAWDPTNPDANANVSALLDDLQANIVAGHGRTHTRHLFLAFDPARAAITRTFLRQFGWHIKSARQQALDSLARRQGQGDGGMVRCLLLSFAGYQALGIPNAAPGAATSAFRLGMKARRAELADPATTQWEPLYRNRIDAMLLIADADPARLQDEQESLTASFAAIGTRVLGVEVGLQQFNDAGNGIEHFGYVDGRSQPLFLRDQIERERNGTDGIDVWDPSFGPDLVLETKGAGAAKKVTGSYFVFRKLEQNVRAFKTAEKDLATRLGLTPANEELAGALVVGRFEDGTPVVLRNRDGMGGGVANNFDFDEDRDGARCPLHAHIRKTNPRGSGGRESVALERRHLMARRGITYGTRAADHSDQPTAGVGLLFMAYQQSIENQFEFVQKNWANAGDFPFTTPPRPVGIDPVIGQGPRRPNTQLCPVRWADPASPTQPANFSGHVTMKGGEYFFAPTLSALRAL